MEFRPKRLIDAINSASSIALSTGIYKVSANEDLKPELLIVYTPKVKMR